MASRIGLSLCSLSFSLSLSLAPSLSRSVSYICFVSIYCETTHATLSLFAWMCCVHDAHAKRACTHSHERASLRMNEPLYCITVHARSAKHTHAIENALVVQPSPPYIFLSVHRIQAHGAKSQSPAPLIGLAHFRCFADAEKLEAMSKKELVDLIQSVSPLDLLQAILTRCSLTFLLSELLSTVCTTQPFH